MKTYWIIKDEAVREALRRNKIFFRRMQLADERVGGYWHSIGLSINWQETHRLADGTIIKSGIAVLAIGENSRPL